MLRRPFLLLISALALSSQAQAQVSDDAVRRRDLGGGFIQMLLTFRDPTPRMFVDRERYDPPSEDYVAVVSTVPVRARLEALELSGRPQNVPPIVALRRAPQMVPFPPRVVRIPELPPEFRRQEVKYKGHLPVGTIIVDTPRRLLFLVQENGRAIRYGIGVGRPGFEWAGVKEITRKAEWPDWVAPREMLKRRPDIPRIVRGGDPENPLGSRALYLGSSLYRIHGTNEPESIGFDVSSGCIRMRNEDIADLYSRVKVGTKVLVI
jgi:lipoprotein-anchoring transpeptidase ErfK/SrfK